METKKILELIDFFNDIEIEETDVTIQEERANGQLVVMVTYHFMEQTFTTQRLYYKSITSLGNIKNKQQVLAYFGEPVYWLDIDDSKHSWPQGSGESDLEEIVIPDIANEGDEAFKKFLLSLANNGQTGNIQKFTEEGRPAQ